MTNKQKRFLKTLENQEHLFTKLGFKRCKFKYEYNDFKGDICFKGADRAFYRINHLSCGYVIEYAENEADARKNLFWDADIFDDSLPDEEITAQLEAALLNYVIEGIEENEKKVLKTLELQKQLFEELGFEPYNDLSYKGPDGFFYLIAYSLSEYKYGIAYTENEEDATRGIFHAADMFDDDLPEEELLNQLKSALSDYISQEEYDKNDSEYHLCPVCGKHTFEEYDSYEFCPVCKWHDDAALTNNPELRGFYHMNLNEAREAYANGQEIH